MKRMFGCDALPLWSETAPRGEVEAFTPRPRPAVTQMTLADEPQEVDDDGAGNADSGSADCTG